MKTSHSLNPPLLFVVALAAEARPLLTHYGLKRVSDTGFAMYAKESTYLVITGIGKINAAAATAHALSRLPGNGCAINIGIAGSNNHVGSLFRANRIIDDNPSNQQALYPPHISRQHLPGICVRSVDQPATNYQPSEAFDMEAHPYCKTARRYLTAELVQSLKVISDSPEKPLLKEDKKQSAIMFSKQFVSDLIEQNINDIDRYATELVNLARSLPTTNPTHVTTDTTISTSELTDYFMQQMHFTESEGNILVTILNRYAILKQPVPFFNLDDDIFNKDDSRSKPKSAVQHYRSTKHHDLPANASGLLKALEESLQHHYPSYL